MSHIFRAAIQSGLPWRQPFLSLYDRKSSWHLINSRDVLRVALLELCEDFVPQLYVCIANYYDSKVKSICIKFESTMGFRRERNYLCRPTWFLPANLFNPKVEEWTIALPFVCYEAENYMHFFAFVRKENRKQNTFTQTFGAQNKKGDLCNVTYVEENKQNKNRA